MLPKVKDAFETLEELITTNKSLIRFGESEYGVMSGCGTIYQVANINLVRDMLEDL